MNQHSEIGDVRGIGAMIAIEFVKNGDPSQPNSEICPQIVRSCADNGLIVLSAGTYKNVLRILSPLVITDEQLDKGLSILETEIKKAINNI
jgi:4-aminobutyrate aminotransferase/(S)-3-amino-2-methylpropionate transaminase